MLLVTCCACRPQSGSLLSHVDIEIKYGGRAATTESTHAERKNLVAERDKFLKWKILVCAVHNIVQVSETKFIRCKGKIHILNQNKKVSRYV